MWVCASHFAGKRGVFVERVPKKTALMIVMWMLGIKILGTAHLSCGDKYINTITFHLHKFVDVQVLYSQKYMHLKMTIKTRNGHRSGSDKTLEVCVHYNICDGTGGMFSQDANSVFIQRQSAKNLQD